ncbi:MULTISPECIES: hypothetical protein [Comamonas]|uniref:hypothetical protein n=1 Tax=Comamonas TaxID=283 RepID=UPI00237D9E4A|nr:hypothetical protein [Comamonas aquatica]MDE1555896.1 hypothetical protein [Comamonas aquatica]
MHPEINLSDFKATATIDWLDIAVTLGRTTQFQYVQAELHGLLGLSPSDAVIHVTPQNVDKRTDAATGFVLRLQEHHHGNNAAKIAHVVLGLAARFEFAAPARIAAIEVAFDLKPRHDPQAVYDAYALLQGGIAAYGEHARQYAPSVRHGGQVVPLTLDPLLAPSGTLYVGHHDAKHGHQPTPKAYRVYAKVTDNNAAPLSPEQHRARAEVTLQLDALEEYGLTDPLALASYDFTRLAGLLHFQPLKSPADIYENYIAQVESDLRAAVMKRRKTGKRPPEEFLRRMRSRLTYRKAIARGLASIARNTDRVIDWHSGWEGSEGRPLQHSKDTAPDAKLNRKVKAALAALTKSMDRAVSPTSKKRAKRS